MLGGEFELLRKERQSSIRESASGPSAIPTVFISSTIEDLTQYRDAALESAIKVEFFPLLSENFAAAGHQPPLSACLEQVDRADVLVCIVAHRYGWVPPDLEGGQRKSITWLECERAERNGKEVLAFLIDDGVDWPERFRETAVLTSAVEAGTASEQMLADVSQNVRSLREFKSWLSAGRIRAKVKNVDDLRSKIIHALFEWRKRHSAIERTDPSGLYLSTVESSPREMIMSGVNAVAVAVAKALGPNAALVSASNMGLSRLYRRGRDIASAISVRNEYERIGAQQMVSLAQTVLDMVGDGSKTAILIAQTLIRGGFEAIAKGMPAHEIVRSIERGIRAAEYVLDAHSSPTTLAQLERVILAAAHGDEINKSIADAMRRAGKDGVVIVARILGTDVSEVKQETGFVIDEGYRSPYFSNQPTGECVLSDALVLVSDLSLSFVPMLPFLEVVARSKKNLVIFAREVTGEALAVLTVNNMRGTLPCVVVRIPGVGRNRALNLEDLSAFTGARPVAEEYGQTIRTVAIQDLGHADKVIVSATRTTLRQESPNAALEPHLEKLRSEIAATSDAFGREKLQERLANLLGCIVTVRVGSITQSELDERAYKAESAMHSARMALETGSVPGAGVALVAAGNAVAQLSRNDEVQAAVFPVVVQALEQPTRALARNAGMDIEQVIAEAKLSSTQVLDVNSRSFVSTESGPTDATDMIRTALRAALSTVRAIVQTESWMLLESQQASEDKF
jgi:chaperonin GroEL